MLRDGVCFARGSRQRGQWMMRLPVISWPTDADVDLAAYSIINAWRLVQKNAVA